MRKYTPSSLNDGIDVSLSCMDTVFHRWFNLFEPVIRSMPIDDQRQDAVIKLKESIDDAREENDFFNTHRPGLSAAIENEIATRRQKGIWPTRPAQLTLGSKFEYQYMTELQACNDRPFLADINKRIPFAIQDAPITFSYMQDVPVGDCPGSCIYIPVERKKVIETHKYKNWVQIFKRRGEL